MTWIGQKKLAFIPVQRPTFDEFPAPTDWPNEIMRRAVFDPPNPSSPTLPDRSLRAYIFAASSGRADLDAVVMPMQVINRGDVPPDALEAQLGSQLRDQGFDAAALVMLGRPPCGTSQLGGFWARFCMSENVGAWAMEFMHCLTGLIDLRSLPRYLDNEVHQDTSAFDEMASNRGMHPSAYTKATIGWLDQSAIAQHVGRTVEYNLHSVGLIQPPPSGRLAAVRIGAQVPYLMVESRRMVDQFESNIGSDGVIVYLVQTSDPFHFEANNVIPLALLTATALTVGETFTSDTGVIVRVTGAISGGFSVRIEDPSLHVVDRSAQYGAPAAAAPPTACVVPGLGVHDIAYRDTSGDLHELWRDAQGGTGTTDLTKIAVGGAPTASGTPFFYVDTTRSVLILLYRDANGTVRSLYWSTGEVGADNLSGTADAPKAAGDPVGYYVPDADTHHVIYRTGDGNLHELNWIGVTPVTYGGNITGAISAPHAAGDPTAFVGSGGYNIVVYRSVNGDILSLYWLQGGTGLDELSVVAGTPKAAGDPFGYYTAYNDTIQIVYCAGDGHVFELYAAGNDTITGWDITPTDAPLATGNLAAYYSAGTNTKHVFYRSADGQLHEIWWMPGGGTPAHVNLTERFGAPLAADRPAAFTVEGPNTQHVAYRGTDNHIYEVIW